MARNAVHPGYSAILVDDEPVADRAGWRALRRRVQHVLQNPYGSLGVDSFTDETLSDPRVLSLAERIRFDAVPDPSFPRLSSTVRIRTHAGDLIEATAPDAKGSPENPLGRADVERKFADNARMALPEDNCEQIVERFRALADEGTCVRSSVSGHPPRRERTVMMDDRHSIEDLLARFVYALDRLEWEAFEPTMTPDFRYGFKEPDGERWVWFEGRDEMLQRIRAVAERARVSQHFCPNPLIELAGDEATMLVNHMAYVWVDDPAGGVPQLRTVAGRWEAEVRRTPERGWRFAGMVFDPTFLTPWEDDLRAFPPRGPVAGSAWGARTAHARL